MPIGLLWVAVAVGLYPLVKTGLLDFIHEYKIGTEIFVTVATLVAVLGGETVGGAVLMVIILIAEFIAELNTDRARASIKSLIGSVPQVGLVRGADGERSVALAELRARDIVLVRAGEEIPVESRRGGCRPTELGCAGTGRLRTIAGARREGHRHRQIHLGREPGAAARK